MSEHSNIADAVLEDAILPFVDRPTAITVSDLSQADAPLVFCNAAFSEMTGYRPQEVIGQNCRFLQGEDRDQAARRAIRNAISERREGAFCLANYRKAGEQFANLLMLAPLSAPSGRHYILGCQYELKTVNRYDDIAQHISDVRGVIGQVTVQSGFMSPEVWLSLRARTEAIALSVNGSMLKARVIA